MLAVRNLVKDYKGGKDWIRAVNGVSFVAEPGQIVGILGPNGAGKTTLLRCVAGILMPTAGNILINGVDTQLEAPKSKQGLAYVPEVPALYELLTVDEHLKFVAMCFKTIDVYESRREELLQRYHLWDKREELVATLSKGMRQKLTIACAMIHNANVFLFDEPLIGIDPAGVAEVKNELRSIKESGGSVLISTHLLDTAERFCDRILIMAKGTLLFDGTMETLRAQSHTEGASLEEMFLKLTGDQVSEATTVPAD